MNCLCGVLGAQVFVLIALEASGSAFPDRYWPDFPAPERVILSETHTGLSYAENVLLETLSGLVALETKRRGYGEMVWVGSASPSYEEWLRRCAQYLGFPIASGTFTVWDLVDRYRERGTIKGYILYRKESGDRPMHEGRSADTSVNVATALCSIFHGVAIEEGIEQTAKRHGLKCLLDVREKDEQWLWESHGERFARNVLGRQDPKNPVMRGSAVAMRTLLVSNTDALYEAVLARMWPGSPILGWGIGLEDAQTLPASRFGIFQTATNWCINLPLLSSGQTGLRYPFQPFCKPSDNSPPRDMRDTRYVSFVMSDGDNVQWLMLNFCKGEEAQQYWACPDRGQMPLGWTLPAADLLQLCPYTLDYLRETASPNDDFMLLGGGYYYPDHFGEARPEKHLLGRQARRTAKYMDKCGLTTLMVNIQDWDSEEAIRAYETYARKMPNLEGIFVVQYAPYTAGNGAIRWVRMGNRREVPVITARNAIWSQRGDHPAEGPPGKVAALLNRWAETPVEQPEDRFAWVIVHCWSWFRKTELGAPSSEEEVEQKYYPVGEEIARGYHPALWAAERLSPKIRVVTPSGLVRRLRTEGGAVSGGS